MGYAASCSTCLPSLYTLHLEEMIGQNRAQLNLTIDGRGEGWMSMQPQTCITPPQSYRKAAEEMFGHVVRVGGVQSLTQCSTNGANGGNSIRAPASQRLDNNGEKVHTRCPASWEVRCQLPMDTNTEGMALSRGSISQC